MGIVPEGVVPEGVVPEGVVTEGVVTVRQIVGAELGARIVGRADEVGPQRARRPRCLIAVARSERGLSRCLVDQLAFEVPAIEFVLADDGRPFDAVSFDAVWCCGFESDSPARVRALRAAHPQSLLLVSGSGARGWQRAARYAGADIALSWSTSLAGLQDALIRRAGERRS